jgi:hypothetical protein
MIQLRMEFYQLIAKMIKYQQPINQYFCYNDDAESAKELSIKEFHIMFFLTIIFSSL